MSEIDVSTAAVGTNAQEKMSVVSAMQRAYLAGHASGLRYAAQLIREGYSNPKRLLKAAADIDDILKDENE